MGTETKKTKQKSREYPAITLEQAIMFVGKFKDYPVDKPISYDMAAKECKVSSSTKSFRYSVSAARQFGLISTSAGSTFTLLNAAKRLIRPTESEMNIKALKIECFCTPKLYSELIASYNGKSIPAVSTIENLLVNFYQITVSSAKVAAQKFVDSATELGLVQNGILCLGNEIYEDNVSTNDVNTEVLGKDGEETINKETLAPIGALEKCEFAAPLNISFGDERRAVLYMPIDATKEDAEYVKDMISLMFKRVYKVD